MPVLKNTLLNPNQDPVVASVTIQLVADDDKEAGGYVTSDGFEIVGRWDANTDSTGYWSATVVANSDILPANTYYRVTEKPSDAPPVYSNVIVPGGAGPYALYDVLKDDPATMPPAAALANHIANASNPHAAAGYIDNNISVQSFKFTPSGYNAYFSFTSNSGTTPDFTDFELSAWDISGVDSSPAPAGTHDKTVTGVVAGDHLIIWPAMTYGRGDMFITANIATVVAGVPVNYFGVPIALGGLDIPAWGAPAGPAGGGDSSTDMPAYSTAHPRVYTVVAGDVTNGTVILRLFFATVTATDLARFLYAMPGLPMKLNVVNLGQ